jgi:transposase
MEVSMQAYLGIDIAKANFHAVLLVDDVARKHSFPNSARGFAQLDHWLAHRAVTHVHACMEATGAYAEALAAHLSDAGHVVSIVNPARVKGYAQSEGARSKTDAVDAALIARFCKALRPPAWLPPAPELRVLQGLVRRLESLQQTRLQEHNRAQTPGVVPAVADSIAALIAHLDQQIADLELQIRSFIDQHPGLRDQHALLVSIPGVGAKTAAHLLGELPDVTRFASAKAVAAYAGLSVAHYTSGTSVARKPHLSKRGNAKLRTALFYPAMVAVRYNPILRSFAARLRAAGKRKMQILGAAMRKLLHIVYGVLKSRTPFNPNHITLPA